MKSTAEPEEQNLNEELELSHHFILQLFCAK
jgi:hypothetical protein